MVVDDIKTLSYLTSGNVNFRKIKTEISEFNSIINPVNLRDIYRAYTLFSSMKFYPKLITYEDTMQV